MGATTTDQVTGIMQRDTGDPGYVGRDPMIAPLEADRPYTGVGALDTVLNAQRQVSNVDFANAVENSRELRRNSLRRIGKWALITAGVGAALAFGPDIIHGIVTGDSPSDSFGKTLGALNDLSKGGDGGEEWSWKAHVDSMFARLTEGSKKLTFPDEIGGKIFDTPTDKVLNFDSVGDLSKYDPSQVVSLAKEGRLTLDSSGPDLSPRDLLEALKTRNFDAFEGLDVDANVRIPVKGGALYDVADSFLDNIGVDNHAQNAADFVETVRKPVTSLFGRGPLLTTGDPAAGTWAPYWQVPLGLYAGNRARRAMMPGVRNLVDRSRPYIAPTRQLRQLEEGGLDQRIEQADFEGNVALAADARTARTNFDQRLDYINENSELIVRYP